MKTETAIRSPEPLVVTQICCEPGELVGAGRILAIVEPT
jgi:biotin carboxyl carrier protein